MVWKWKEVSRIALSLEILKWQSPNYQVKKGDSTICIQMLLLHYMLWPHQFDPLCHLFLSSVSHSLWSVVLYGLTLFSTFLDFVIEKLLVTALAIAWSRLRSAENWLELQMQNKKGSRVNESPVYVVELLAKLKWSGSLLWQYLLCRVEMRIDWSRRPFPKLVRFCR